MTVHRSFVDRFRGGGDGRFKFLTAVAMGALLLALLPVSVAATTPGHNGLIGFRRFLDQEQTRAALFVINPDGTHETQIRSPATTSSTHSGTGRPMGRSSPSCARRRAVRSAGRTSCTW